MVFSSSVNIHTRLVYGIFGMRNIGLFLLRDMGYTKGHLAIRRVFSLIARISKTEFSNCPDVFTVCTN